MTAGLCSSAFLTKIPLGTSHKQLTGFQTLPGKHSFFSWKQFSARWVEPAHKFLKRRKKKKNFHPLETLALVPGRGTHVTRLAPLGNLRAGKMLPPHQRDKATHPSGVLPAPSPSPSPLPVLLCCDSRQIPARGVSVSHPAGKLQ